MRHATQDELNHDSALVRSPRMRWLYSFIPTLNTFSRAMLWLAVLVLGFSRGLSGGLVNANHPRTVISLDGVWQIGEGTMLQPPAEFEHNVPVPGLVSLARPPFVEAGPVVADRNSAAQKDPRRDAFWYRRHFNLPGPVPSVARLKIGKAMFGSRVVLNGKVVGEHLPSFTPGFFDVRGALLSGDNEIMIRVGADRDAVRPQLADGFDYEKTRYIPGIFDSVELELSGTPHVLNLQVAPDLKNSCVKVKVQLANAGNTTSATLRFTVREAKSRRVISQRTAEEISLEGGAERSVTVMVPMPQYRSWSPEDPFLYEFEADTGADRAQTRFGMRTFQFDAASKKALLNGKTYFMRGSNITLYRFFEDQACGELPWDINWVRKLHRRLKDMHWNCVRYCIGFPPESWYRIADEEGILIQDEFPIWYGGTGWSKWPQGLKSDDLTIEYQEWMRERWNHPSVVIWDASNETSSPETGLAVQRVRGLDLSQRPWDNSYGTPRVPGDVFESHPYHFQDPNFRLSMLATADPVPQGNALRNPGDSPVIINEYGWLWLHRDGTPTTLTQTLYRNLLGTNSTTLERRRLYARYLAAETEFWRSHRQAAAVMHFTALGYSRPSGQTSDHWLDVASLEWEPEFYQWVRDAFAPIAVAINDWSETLDTSGPHEFPIVLMNDEDRDWKGKLSVRMYQDGRRVEEKVIKVKIPRLGLTPVTVALPMPSKPGQLEIQAVLTGPSTAVKSIRDFRLISAGSAVSAR